MPPDCLSRTSADRSAGTLDAHSAADFARDVPRPAGRSADSRRRSARADCTKQTARADAAHDDGADALRRIASARDAVALRARGTRLALGHTMTKRLKPRHSYCGKKTSGRRALVGRPASRHDAATDCAGRRCQCRRAVLQPRAAARALQHGRHAQGAAHRAPDHRLRVLLGHGTHPLLDRRRHLRLARPAVRPHRRRARSPARYGATRFQEQRNERYRQRPRGHAGGAGQVRAGRTRPGRQHQFLQQGRRSTTAARCGSAAGHARAGQYVDLRFEMDTLVLLHAGPHPLATGARLCARRRAAAGASRRAARTDDPCRTRCPENERGFINTERLVPGRRPDGAP